MDSYPMTAAQLAARVAELEREVFEKDQAIAVLRTCLDRHQRDEADPPGYLQDAVIKAAGLSGRLQECERLREDAEAWRKVDSRGRYWLTIRGKVIDALSREGLTIVTTAHGIHLMRLGKAIAQGADGPKEP